MAAEPSLGAKQRKYARIGLPKGPLVAWQGTGERYVSRVGTLSLGGLYIRTSDPAPAGTVLKLIFQLPGGEVRARARVRYTDAKRGMGVEFTGMGYEARARLHQVLKRLLS